MNMKPSTILLHHMIMTDKEIDKDTLHYLGRLECIRHYPHAAIRKFKYSPFKYLYKSENDQVF